MRDAVQEIGGAIERINDPARLGRVALDHAAFFEQKAPVGPGALQFLDQRLFRLLVGLRHEVGRPLAGHLKMLDLAEVAAQLAACLARGAFHDGEKA